MALITLKDYAIRLGKNPVVSRQKALRGGFRTARKIGRDWFIDEDEPYTDNRVKSGKYVNWRKGGKHMKFTQLTNEFCGARKAGYALDLNAQHEVNQPALDDLRHRRGESAVNNLIDSLSDNEGDLFQGEDGEYYTVEFDYSASPAVIAAWHRLVKTND